MDKLSSIIPSTSRVTSVNLDEAPPARPGAPTFGRKEGVSTVRDRVSLQNSLREASADTMYGRNPQEAAKAKIVDNITQKFFNTRLTDVEKQPTLTEKINDQVNEGSVPLRSSLGERRSEALAQYDQVKEANVEPQETSTFSIEA